MNAVFLLAIVAFAAMCNAHQGHDHSHEDHHHVTPCKGDSDCNEVCPATKGACSDAHCHCPGVQDAKCTTDDQCDVVCGNLGGCCHDEHHCHCGAECYDDDHHGHHH